MNESVGLQPVLIYPIEVRPGEPNDDPGLPPTSGEGLQRAEDLGESNAQCLVENRRPSYKIFSALITLKYTLPKKII